MEGPPLPAPAPPRIADGVFFQAPELLPRGRHTLARDEVLAVQRERLLGAVTELLAHSGQRAVTVGAIAAQAGVSRGAFYDCFASKDECAFAAYDRFIAVLLEQIGEETADTDSWEAFVAALVGSYCRLLERDLVVARAFQVEMDAAGAPARERRRRALVRFAQLIHEQRSRFDIRPELPLSAYVGVVYAIRQLASDALDSDPRPDLSALATEISGWIARFLGPARA